MSEFLLKVVVAVLIGLFGAALVAHDGGPEWAQMMTGWLTLIIIIWSSK